MIGIYCYRHRDSGMCYVGQSVNIDARIYEHNRFKDKNSYIDRAINRYGIDAFEVEILELCEEDNLDARECHWIATLGCMRPNGYNLRSGGARGRHCAETKRKISEVQKGRIISAETRKKLSDFNKGKKLSAEHRRKIGDANRNPSDETRQRMSEVNRGRKHTEESRRKMSESAKSRRIRRRINHNPNQLRLFE